MGHPTSGKVSPMSVSSDSILADHLSRDAAPARNTMSSRTAHPLNEALRKLDLGNAPPEEFDNFYTPENDIFYANSSYLPLDTAQPSIRLLRVHPKRRSLEEHLGDNPRWAARHAAIGNSHGS